MNDRIARGLLLAVTAAALCGDARAQDKWPSRPVRLVSTSVAGGNIDIMCRIIAEKLSLRLGQPVVVDNKPGAATVLGTAEAAKAPPDGYTFLITIMSSMVGNRVLRANLPYDPVKDFEPVTQISTGNVLLVGPASAPYRDLKASSNGEEARAAGQLRVDRGGHLAAPLRRDPGEGVRRAAQSRPLQGRGAGHRRRDERHAGCRLGEHPDRETPRLRRESPRARDHRPEALRRLAGASDFAEQGFPGFEMPVWGGAYLPAERPGPSSSGSRARSWKS